MRRTILRSFPCSSPRPSRRWQPPLRPTPSISTCCGKGGRSRGDVRGAARDLRLACFGLLDEPRLLAGCLDSSCSPSTRRAAATRPPPPPPASVEVEERFRIQPRGAAGGDPHGGRRAPRRAPAGRDAHAGAGVRRSARPAAGGAARHPARTGAGARARTARHRRARRTSLAARPRPDRPRPRSRRRGAHPARRAADRGARRLPARRGPGRPGRCPEANPALPPARSGERARFVRPRLALSRRHRRARGGRRHLQSLPAAVRDDASLRRLRRDLERAQRESRAVPPTPVPRCRPNGQPPVASETSRHPAGQPVVEPPSPVSLPDATPPTGVTAAERARLDALTKQLAGARRAVSSTRRSPRRAPRRPPARPRRGAASPGRSPTGCRAGARRPPTRPRRARPGGAAGALLLPRRRPLRER